VDRCEPASVVPIHALRRLLLLDGAFVRSSDAFAVVGIVAGLRVVVGRVALVTGVDVLIVLGEEFVVIVAVVVDYSIAMF
jgi:hypothetical protein